MPTQPIPSAAELPAGLPTDVREAFERIYRHLRGPTHIGQGATRNGEYRMAVGSDGRLEIGSWADRDFAARLTVDPSGDVRPGRGVIATSPDGTEWRITVDNAGVVTATAVT